jgi:hypothetical protein
MELSDLTVRLIILLIPGTICSLIIETIALHKKWSQVRLFISSVLLGAFTMCIVQLFYWLIQLVYVFSEGFGFKNLKTWECLFDDHATLFPGEVILFVLFAVAIGYGFVFIINSKLLFKIADKLKLSNKFGDDSLYLHFLNSQGVHWVYVRDKKRALTYRGQIESFSEDEKEKELLLTDVTVYDYETSEEVYAMSKVYLSFHNRDITIEYLEPEKPLKN